MAVDAGGARLIKEDKQALSAKSLKNSELKMLLTLVVVAIAALTIYFILLPMYQGLAVLEEENITLRIQESEYTNQVDKIPDFQNMLDTARSDYYRYVGYFHRPMEPELLDERITSMLISHGMTPSSFTMTTLEVKGIPPYFAEELRANPAPLPLGAEGEETAEGEQAEAGGGTVLDNAAENAEAAAEGAEVAVYEDYAFVYTINVSARGDRNNLFTFLAQVAPMTAMYVTEFSFTDPIVTPATTPGGTATTTPGIIDMTIKLYVYVEGVTANEQASAG
jgi:hypothetical protein